MDSAIIKVALNGLTLEELIDIIEGAGFDPEVIETY